MKMKLMMLLNLIWTLDDNPHGDIDAARYGVFMHNKSTTTFNSTYISSTVTSSSLDFIQALLDETPELTDFMSHLVYIDAQTTSMVHNPKGNPKLTSYILGASEVPLGTHVDLLNRINSNKSNETHTTHQQLYETLYESMTLDQDALDAQVAQSSFYKRSHDNQVPPNNHEGKNKKKRQKDVGEPSSRSSRRNRSSMVLVQDDTPAMRTTWFDLFLKSDIDKDKDHILGPSTVVIAKNFKELVQKDERTIADLEGVGLERLKAHYNNDVELEYHVSQLKESVLSEAQWNSDEGDVSKPISFERHMSKSTKPHPCFYNIDYTYLVDLSTEEKYITSITKHYTVRYYKEGIEDRILKRWSKEVSRYHFEALNGIHHWEEDKIDLFKAGMSVVTEGNVYSDLRIKSVVCIVVKKKCGYGFLTSIIVRRSDDKEYEFRYAGLPRLSVNNFEDMYLLHVQDKLHHLPLEFMKDFNNALLMFIRRTVIKNRVEDIKLRVEIYQRSLNLTKPTMFFEGIDQRIPFTMTATHKGSSNEMLKKIDEILKHREQIKRLEEYVEGRPKTVNPHTFVRHL
ncbi:hypothetical protein Tco_0798841 [Tanacetum coccineum]